MTLTKKFIKFVNDNVVLITGVSIIVGFHWAWWKLQNVPTLVHPSEKKEMPIVLGARSVKELVANKFNELTNRESKTE